MLVQIFITRRIAAGRNLACEYSRCVIYYRQSVICRNLINKKKRLCNPQNLVSRSRQVSDDGDDSQQLKDLPSSYIICHVGYEFHLWKVLIPNWKLAGHGGPARCLHQQNTFLLASIFLTLLYFSALYLTILACVSSYQVYNIHTSSQTT